MNRRLFKSLSLWIVPLLIARAMIPAGYMVMTDAAGLRLMFCPTVIAPAVTPQQADLHADHAEHHNAMQHTDHAQGHDSGGSGDHVPCPFSLVASAALVDVPFLASVAGIAADELVGFTSAPAFSAGPIRAERIRGPPHLS